MRIVTSTDFLLNGLYGSAHAGSASLRNPDEPDRRVDRRRRSAHRHARALGARLCRPAWREPDHGAAGLSAARRPRRARGPAEIGFLRHQPVAPAAAVADGFAAATA